MLPALPNTPGEAIARLQTMSASQAMVADERARGFSVLPIDIVDWFTSKDWRADSVISVDKARREIRIIAVAAVDRRTGALSRMIRGIRDAGYTPVIIEPMLDMPAILAKWGWTRSTVGAGFHHEEQWRP